MNGATRFKMQYSLETSTVWRVEATIVRSANFPADELVNFQINAGQSRSVTNSGGSVFVCTFDGRVFEISAPSGSDDLKYVTIPLARDEAGNPLKTFRRSFTLAGNRYASCTWRIGQLERSMSRVLKERYGLLTFETGPPPTLLDIRLAFPKVITTEFFVKPKPKD